jgi:hypothetical protein
MQVIADRYLTEKQTLHSYLPFYDNLFGPILSKIKRVLYVTKHHDESVQMFRSYFGQAEVSVILVEDESSGNLSDIRMMKENPLSFEFISKYTSCFDVVIYDGQQDLQILKLVAREYSRLLTVNGILVIESIVNPLWIGDIRYAFPEHLRSKAYVSDQRKIKCRPDDILIVLDLNTHESSINYLAPGSMMNKSRTKPILPMIKRAPRIPRSFDGIISYQTETSRTDIAKYPTLFHKYLIRTACEVDPVYHVILDTMPYQETKKYLCHFHIYNLDLFDEFREIVLRIHRKMGLIVTYSCGDPSVLLNIGLNNLILLKIENQGYDIGGKICGLDYLYRRNLPYDYILFLHSKSDSIKRSAYFDSFVKSDQRLDLLCTLMEMSKTNLLGIFPNLIWYDHDGVANNYDKYVYDQEYWKEILDYMSCDNRDRIFAEGNCMILHTTVIDFIFKSRINLWYNLLNRDNSFDWNWFRIYYPEHGNRSVEECHRLYQEQILYGNNTPVKQSEKSIPDGMFEHIFERIWINVIKHLQGNYLVLDKQNLVDRYKIRVNAVYFPQFHEIPENDTFWGNGFTEWTLLRPYPDQVHIDGEEYSILKPHSDIGYYNLSTIAPLYQQIEIAKDFGINGFIVYHYWFKDNHKVLYRPLEYFLSPKITFPFAISWANETWSRRWDGSNKEVLLSQEYGTIDDYRTHIQYLIPFFQRENYMRTVDGQCMFYIYNFADLQPYYRDMMQIWNQELSKVGLSIKMIITENSFRHNHDLQIKETSNFIFEPMYSTNYVQRLTPNYRSLIANGVINRNNFDFKFYLNEHTDIRETYRDNYDAVFDHFVEFGVNENRVFKYNDTVVLDNYIYNYESIIDMYKKRKYATDGKYLGLPLYWNNMVRRKGIPFLLVNNFSLDRLQEMLNVLICTILLRYTNQHVEPLHLQDNIINVNAWNEWNEQAILEPNNVTGYSNLETINSVLLNI